MYPFKEKEMQENNFGARKVNPAREAVNAIKRKQQNELAEEQLKALAQAVAVQDMQIKIGTLGVFATFNATPEQVHEITSILTNKF